jgi:hypothetical protein
LVAQTATTTTIKNIEIRDKITEEEEKSAAVG